MEKATEAERIGRQHFRLVAQGVAEREALHYSAGRVSGTHIVLTAAARSGVPADWERAWDLVIRSRAVVLDDWDMVERAAQRALHLMQELAGATIIKDWADRQDPDRKAPAPIPLRLWQVNRLLGTAITTDEAAQLLQSLGLKVQPMGNAQSSNQSAVNMMVQAPSFRRDLLLEVDLIEEIARRHGLDNICSKLGFRGSGGGLRRTWDLAGDRIRHWLAANGFHEIVTSSFGRADDPVLMRMGEDDPRRPFLAVINPRQGGETQLRTSLLPGLLETVGRNLNAGARPPLRLFQINRVYRPGQARIPTGPHPDDVMLPAEPVFLQICIAGDRQEGLDGVPADLLLLKGVLKNLRALLRLDLGLSVQGTEPWLAPGSQSAVLTRQGQTIGSIGRIDPEVAAAFDIEAPVAVAEIRIDDLNLEGQKVEFKSFGRYPGVRRDLSLLVPQGVAFARIVQVVRSAGGELLESVDLFDLYRGKGLPEGAGAYGIRLMFRSAKGNLKGKTIDRVISGILDALRSELEIEQRG